MRFKSTGLGGDFDSSERSAGKTGRRGSEDPAQRSLAADESWIVTRTGLPV
jgi:hypothetical protein